MKVKLNTGAPLLYTFILMASFAFSACSQNGKAEKHEQTIKVENVKSEKPEHSGLDVSFIGENGKAVSLASLKGKVVFINFWATWCPPCIHEMPSINKLKQSFAGNDKIVFLMVDVEGKMKESMAFMEKNKYDLPVYIPGSDIPAEYLGSSIPTTVILSKSGDMMARIEGGRDYTSPEMVKVLNELVESN